MDSIWTISLTRQFGAAIKMLEDALQACPDELWSGQVWNEPGFSQFWYVAYHTLFWLDLYLSGAVEDFVPPPPFTLDELDPAGLLPERTYSRDELLAYLEHCRRKSQATIEPLTDVQARRRCAFTWGEINFAELLLDNLRHVQEHAAQLNLFLGQQTGAASGWVSGGKE